MTGVQTCALPISPDGKFLYYAKGLTVPGLWRIPTNGGEEVEIIGSLEAGYWGYWAVVDNGIYHLDTTREPIGLCAAHV